MCISDEQFTSLSRSNLCARRLCNNKCDGLVCIMHDFLRKYIKIMHFRSKSAWRMHDARCTNVKHKDYKSNYFECGRRYASNAATRSMMPLCPLGDEIKIQVNADGSVNSDQPGVEGKQNRTWTAVLLRPRSSTMSHVSMQVIPACRGNMSQLMHS